ncbi:MAG: helix-turn-helix domain-containing protein [Pasteurella sp.]|nr:helix-turn-helix domain-containing protein [Pasteurella sp.]
MKLKEYLKKNRGSRMVLAEELGISPQSITHWIKNQIPADRVLAIYFATKRQVKPYEMRPDLYPKSLLKIRGD